MLGNTSKINTSGGFEKKYFFSRNKNLFSVFDAQKRY
jgi:hypothetical protein